MTGTTEDVRNRVAELHGFHKAASSATISFEHWRGQDGYAVLDLDDELPTHPFPETLDAAASALPEGWTWNKARRWFTAHRIGKPDGGKNNVRVPDTGDEIADRYALALKALESQRSTR